MSECPLAVAVSELRPRSVPINESHQADRSSLISQIMEAKRLLLASRRAQADQLVEILEGRQQAVARLRASVAKVTLQLQRERELEEKARCATKEFVNSLGRELEDLSSVLCGQMTAELEDVENLQNMLKPLPLLHNQILSHTSQMDRWARCQRDDAEARKQLADELGRLRVAKLDALENERLHMVESYDSGSRRRLLERLSNEDLLSIKAEMHTGTLRDRSVNTSVGQRSAVSAAAVQHLPAATPQKMATDDLVAPCHHGVSSAARSRTKPKINNRRPPVVEGPL